MDAYGCRFVITIVLSALPITGAFTHGATAERSTESQTGAVAEPVAERVAKAATPPTTARGVQSSARVHRADRADRAAATVLRAIDPPLFVRLRLRDGAMISGTATSFGDEVVVGSFGRRPWEHFQPIESWRLFRRLMDRESAEDWIALGRIMLLSAGGEGLAESAFRRAVRLDADATERIAEARAVAADRIRRREAPPDAGIAVDRLRLHPPEWTPWSATEWPSLDDAANAVAARTIHDDVTGLLAVLGLSLEMVRTDSLLLYGTGERLELARLIVQLEATRTELARQLGVEPRLLEPYGRIAIVIFDDRDDFRAVQQRVFLQQDRREVGATAHFIGRKAYVVARRGSGGPELAHRVARQLVHAFMHGYISPRRLPPWANEGLAESVAARVVPELGSPEVARRESLRAIRRGFDPRPTIAAAYGDPQWPGPFGSGPVIGRLLVELLSADRPEAFRDWVIDVKVGQQWDESLASRMGVSLPQIANRFVQYHQTRD